MPCTAAEMATLVESIGAASAEIVCHQGAAQTASAALSQGASRGLLEGGLARAMQEGFSGYTGEVALLASSVDVMFMLFCAYLVFLMQAGFAMLCAGAVRSKNTVNILLKNVMDACGGALAYWLLGFGFAYGVCGDDKTGNAFIGCGQFAMSGDFSQYQQYSFWLFQWAFAAAASTITVGSIAERTHFVAYLVFSVFLSAWVYPVVSHWVWDSSGWLSSFKDDPFLTVGVIDFAGCGVVHMVGGLAGLAGAVLVGPRTGRFDAMGFPINLPGHSATLLCLGTFLLWFGWYGFNPGSMLMISTPAAALVVARSAATTTLSAAGGGIAQLILCRWQSGAWDMINVCNGLLTGLVSITAAAPVVEPWAAVIIGAIGAVIFNYGGKLLLRLQIDDPLEAVNMHAFGGAWGLLAVALFAKDTYVAETFSASVAVNGKGIFYGGYKLLGSQIIAIIVISAWTLSWMSALFYGLKQVGYLRVSATDELIGLDQSHHGGSAYPAHATKGPGHSRHGSRHGGEEHEKATGKIDEKDKMLGGDSGPGL